MTKPEGQIDKLPKWARKYISDLQMERDAAVRDLERFIDEQTPSEIFVRELVCDGSSPNGTGLSERIRYIQGRAVEIRHAQIELRVLLRDGAIDLSWTGSNGAGKEGVMIPRSYNHVWLVAR